MSVRSSVRLFVRSERNLSNSAKRCEERALARSAGSASIYMYQKMSEGVNKNSLMHIYLKIHNNTYFKILSNRHDIVRG